MVLLYSAILYNCYIFLDLKKYDGSRLRKISSKYVILRQKTGRLEEVSNIEKCKIVNFFDVFFILP